MHGDRCMCGVAAMELQSTVAHEDIYYISMDNEVGTHAHKMLSLQYIHVAGHPLPLQMEFVYLEMSFTFFCPLSDEISISYHICTVV